MRDPLRPGIEDSTHADSPSRGEGRSRPAPKLKMPKADHRCTGCGKSIRPQHEQCADCAAPIYQRNFEAGRRVAHTGDARAKRAITNKAQAELIKKWNPADLPQWLTRGFYMSRIVPALPQVTKAQIRASLKISEPHANYIQRGKRIPHARHWLALAELAGVRRSIRRLLRALLRTSYDWRGLVLVCLSDDVNIIELRFAACQGRYSLTNRFSVSRRRRPYTGRLVSRAAGGEVTYGKEAPKP